MTAFESEPNGVQDVGPPVSFNRIWPAGYLNPILTEERNLKMLDL